MFTLGHFNKHFEEFLYEPALISNEYALIFNIKRTILGYITKKRKRFTIIRYRAELYFVYELESNKCNINFIKTV